MRALLVVASFFAVATTTVTDAKDVGGKLDLRTARAARDGTLLRLTVKVYGRWSSKLLRRGGKSRLTVLYDVNGDGKADFTGRIVYRGKLSLWITGRHQAFEPVPVSRPTSTSAYFVHPVDVLFHGTGTKTLGIAITSVNGTHRDRMPDKGWAPVVFTLR